MPELLRTRSKAALPQNLVYPVSVEMVSQSLIGIPQYDKTALRFLWKNMTAKWNQDGNSRLKLFEVFYTNPRDTVWPQHWHIDTYGVERDHIESLRTACVELALPAIRDWMTEPRPSFWYEKWKLLEINYDTETAELIYLEPGGF